MGIKIYVSVKHLILLILVVLPSIQLFATDRKMYARDSLAINNYLQQVETQNSNPLNKKTDYEKMFSWLNQASVLSQKINDFKTTYRINSLFTKVYTRSNNISIAMNYSFRNLELLETAYKTNKDTLTERYLFDTYLAIGYGYLFLENYKKTNYYFNRLLIFLKSSKIKNYPKAYHQRMIILNNNIASCYIYSKDFKKAVAYSKKALEYFDENDKNNSYKASIYNNLGIIYQQTKDVGQALGYYNAALKLWEQARDTAGLAKAHNNLGSFYATKPQTCIYFFKKAFYYSQRSGNLKSAVRATDNLSRAYASLSDYRNAFYYKNIADSITDSIMSGDKIRYVTQLELQYQYEKQRKEEEVQKEINEANAQRKIILFSTAVIVLILMLILFILLYRNQQIKNREMELQDKNLKLEKNNLELQNKHLETEIEFKNKELTTNVMYLLKKNELISSISEKLLTLKLNKNPEESKVVKSVIQELKFNIDNNSWNEFEIRFQNVHQEFHKKLIEKFPDLTPNEIKICSFLRLNMSTKEISSITFQSVKSIEVARTRLRKKIDLKRDENLISFLQKL